MDVFYLHHKSGRYYLLILCFTLDTSPTFALLDQLLSTTGTSAPTSLLRCVRTFDQFFFLSS